MTLMRWSLVCALAALCFLLLQLSPLRVPGTLSAPLGFTLFIICAVVLGSLGAFVFKKY